MEQVLLSSSFAFPLQTMLPDMAVEGEDDVFFADLSKQIALLIMDDEEDFPVQYCPPLPAQVCCHWSIHSLDATLLFVKMFQCPEG